MCNPRDNAGMEKDGVLPLKYRRETRRCSREVLGGIRALILWWGKVLLLLLLRKPRPGAGPL